MSRVVEAAVHMVAITDRAIAAKWTVCFLLSFSLPLWSPVIVPVVVAPSSLESVSSELYNKLDLFKPRLVTFLQLSHL